MFQELEKLMFISVTRQVMHTLPNSRTKIDQT